jgi:hypothetical protein
MTELASDSRTPSTARRVLLSQPSLKGRVQVSARANRIHCRDSRRSRWRVTLDFTTIGRSTCPRT